jgi:hypothetical protein
MEHTDQTTPATPTGKCPTCDFTIFADFPHNCRFGLAPLVVFSRIGDNRRDHSCAKTPQDEPALPNSFYDHEEF